MADYSDIISQYGGTPASDYSDIISQFGGVPEKKAIPEARPYPEVTGPLEHWKPSSAEAIGGLADIGALIAGGVGLAARQYAKPVIEGRPFEPVAEVARGVTALPVMAGKAAFGDEQARAQLAALPANVMASYGESYGSPEAAFRTAALQPGRFVTDIMGVPSLAGGATQAVGRVALAPGRAVAAKAYPIARNVVSPLNRFIGETFGAPEIQNALAAAAPGMTVSQALADVNAPLAQAAAESALSVVPTETRAAQLAQEQARAGRMAQIAGTPEDLAALEQARSAEAAANYSQAFKEIMPETPELTTILSRPSMQQAFARAAQIAKERERPFQIGETKPASVVESSIVDEFGRPIRKEIPAEIAQYPVESLHYVKMALDDMIRDPVGFGIGATEVDAITKTRKKFLTQLENNDAYATARARYAEQSVPINRMQVAQELQRALTKPLTGEATRAATFAGAVEAAPRTIKRATGQQFFDRLEDILEPSEMKVVNDIRDEFRRNQLAKEQAAFGRAASESAKELASAKISAGLNIPFLNRAWTIANTVVKRTLGKIDEKLATEIGLMMQDPAELNRAIAKAKEYQKRTESGVAKIRGERAPLTPEARSRRAIGAVNIMTQSQNQNAMAR
jgi:hypothetical protein